MIVNGSVAATHSVVNNIVNKIMETNFLKSVEKVHFMLLHFKIRDAWLVQPINWGEDIPKSVADADSKTRTLVEFASEIGLNSYFRPEGVYITGISESELDSNTESESGMARLLGFCVVEDVETAPYTARINIGSEELIAFRCDTPDSPIPKRLHTRIESVVHEFFGDDIDVSLEYTDKVDEIGEMLYNMGVLETDIPTLRTDLNVVSKLNFLSDILGNYGGLTQSEYRIFVDCVYKVINNEIDEEQFFRCIPYGVQKGYLDCYLESQSTTQCVLV